jgi:hypothetical protein
MPDDATLFVIFHGSWSFLDTPNYVYVKTPEMGDEHVYRSGNWLAEHELPHGSYFRLTNNIGTDPNCRVDPTQHPVIKDAVIAGTRELRGSHTTLLLAKPQKWHQLKQFDLPKGGLVVNNNGYVLCQDPACAPGAVHDPKNNTTRVSFFNVFEYSYNSCVPPCIDGMDWWKPFGISDFQGRGKAATLHFFAEHEDATSSTSHFDQAFRYGSLLLGGDLDIVKPPQSDPLVPLMTPTDTQRPCPPLLDHRLFEFLPLSSRTAILNSIGVGLATLDSEGKPTHDCLDSYWATVGPFLISNLTEVPDATCLPNSGEGGCP